METILQDNATVYEISFFQRVEESEPIKRAIAAQGGVVLEEKPAVKVRFAYPVKKEAQGFMGIIRFRVPGEKLSRLSSTLGLEKGILRFLITRANNVGETVTGEEKGKRRSQRKSSTRNKSKKGFAAAALSNEALEKKIEEISQ